MCILRRDQKTWGKSLSLGCFDGLYVRSVVESLDFGGDESAEAFLAFKEDSDALKWHWRVVHDILCVKEGDRRLGGILTHITVRELHKSVWR